MTYASRLARLAALLLLMGPPLLAAGRIDAPRDRLKAGQAYSPGVVGVDPTAVPWTPPECPLPEPPPSLDPHVDEPLVVPDYGDGRDGAFYADHDLTLPGGTYRYTTYTLRNPLVRGHEAPAHQVVTPVMASSPAPLTPHPPGPEDPPVGPDHGARGEEAAVRGLGIACAIGLCLVPLAPDDTAAGLSADLFGNLAVELQARHDALTGDLDAKDLKRKAALEQALQAIADGSDGVDAVPATVLAVDRILRKAYREEFRPPGSGSSPLPGLSAEIAEALYAELDRVHWTVVSRLYPNVAGKHLQLLIKGSFGKARPALIAARHSLDAGSVPGALRKLAVVGSAIGEWAYYADYPAQTLTAAFLGSTLQDSIGGVACGTDPLEVDLSFGEYDPVSETFTFTGSAHIRAASVTGPGIYALGPGDAWWKYEARPEVWDARPGGWLRVLEGTPGTTPFVGVFEFDATDGKKVLKIRYGCFSASCGPP